MRRDVFFKIYRRLESRHDVPYVSEKYGYGEDVLYSILSQKIVRNTKKDYYLIARQAPAMVREWKRGKTLLQLAEERKFPPILTAGFVLKEMGISKKVMKTYTSAPDDIPDKRLRSEMQSVMEEDFIYSPRGIECQKDRGVFCEDRIKEWLDGRGYTYMTENDSREMGRTKTPDFLFHEPHVLIDTEVHWVESKGSFGSPFQARHDYEKQLRHYVDLFGPGIVAYWVGFVDDIVLDEDVTIVDRTFFD